MSELETLLAHLKRKGVGAWFSIAAGVLAVVALALYDRVILTVPAPGFCLVLVIVIAVLEFFLEGEWTAWMTVAQSSLLMLAFMTSLNVMLDPIGYVVSGLYQYSDIASFVTFGTIVGIAMLCTMVGAFFRHVK